MLKEDGQIDILNKIEMPLIYVLADMECYGFKFDPKPLLEMKKEIVAQIDVITKEIYEMSGEVFNISSPMQLGNILFEKLAIGKSKKTARGYKTDVKTLQKKSRKYLDNLC